VSIDPSGTPSRASTPKQLTIGDLLDAAAATEWSSAANYTHTEMEMTFDTSRITNDTTTMTPLDMDVKHKERRFDGSSTQFNASFAKRKGFLQSSTPLNSDHAVEFHLEFPEPRMDFFLDDGTEGNFPSSAPPTAPAQATQSPPPSQPPFLPSLPSFNKLLIERPVERTKEPSVALPKLRERKEINYTEPTKIPFLADETPRSQRREMRRSKKSDIINFPPSRRSRPCIMPRSKNGCWTCRIRKKKCTEERPHCQACINLGLECDGYELVKPAFMRDAMTQRRRLDAIKSQTSTKKKIGVKKTRT
jgi:hypothetical protein